MADLVKEFAMHSKHKSLALGLLFSFFAVIPEFSFAQISGYSNSLTVGAIAKNIDNESSTPSGTLSESSTYSDSYVNASSTSQASANAVQTGANLLVVSGSFDASASCQITTTQWETIGGSAYFSDSLTFTITSDETVTLTVTGTPGASLLGDYVSGQNQFFSYNSYYGNWGSQSFSNPNLNGAVTMSAPLGPGTWTMGVSEGIASYASTMNNDIFSSQGTISSEYSLQVGTPAAVPEPPSLSPIAAGLLCLGWAGRRSPSREPKSRRS